MFVGAREVTSDAAKTHPHMYKVHVQGDCIQFSRTTKQDLSNAKFFLMSPGKYYIWPLNGPQDAYKVLHELTVEFSYIQGTAYTAQNRLGV